MKNIKIKDSYLGLVIALIFAACVYFLGRPNTPAEVFLSTTNLLFWFYIITSIIWGVIMVLGRFFMLAIRPILRRKGVPSENLHSLGPESFVKSLVRFVAFSGCLVGGAYLLNHALTVTGGNLEWDIIKLALGGVLLIAGLIKGGGYISFKFS